MPGPPPKPAAQRRRRNVVAGARTLHLQEQPKIPELPELEVGWHAATLAWWRDVWSSPMAPEYDHSDIHGLFVLARLVDTFWRTSDPELAKMMATEIRLQRQCFGLSPIDRRRLQWEIDRGEEAVAKTAARKAVPAPAKRAADPRLKAV